MRPITAIVGPLSLASANLLFAPASIVTGGIALLGTQLDHARRIIFTSSGNDTGLTFRISGTNVSGNPISETVTGLSAAAASTVLDYLGIVTVQSLGASAGTVAIGTNGVAGSNWVRLDEWAPPSALIQADVGGTVNFTVQSTLDDPNDPTNPVPPASVNWLNTTDATAITATVTLQTSYTNAPRYVRLLLNSGSGSITATVVQYNVVTR
jgi:hypothetical protein